MNDDKLELNELTADAKDAVDKVENKAAAEAETTVDGAAAVAENIKDEAEELASDVSDNVKGVFKRIKSVFSGAGKAADKAGDAVSDAAENIKDTAAEKAESAADAVSDTVEGIKDGASNVVGGIKDGVSNAVNGIKDRASDAVDGIEDGASNIADGIKDRASDAVDGIEDGASNIAGGIKDGASNAVDGIKDGVSNIVDGIKDGTSDAVEYAKDEVQNAEDDAENAIDDVEDDVDDFSPIEFSNGNNSDNEDDSDISDYIPGDKKKTKEQKMQERLEKKEKKRLAKLAKKAQKENGAAADGDAAALNGIEDEMYAEDDGKKKSKAKKALLISGITVGALGAIYLGGVAFYNSHFFFKTMISGYGCGNMTVQQTEDKIKNAIQNYKYTIYEHNDAQEVINGSDVDLVLNQMGSIEEQKAKQNPWLWCFDYKTRQLELDISVNLDEEKLSQKVDELQAVQASNNAVDPAFVKSNVYYGGGEYYIDGDSSKEYIDSALLHDKVKNGMYGLYADMNLDDEKCYVGISGENRVKSLLDTMDKIVKTTVTYTNGDETYPLDSGTINTWLSVNDDMTANLDYTGVADWVTELAKHYDSIGTNRPFTTSYGEEITVGGGDYGWNVNNAEETDALYNILLSGESTTREPIYKQKAASHGAVDFGNTYIEVSISAQHLWYYKDSDIIVSTDFVSGNPYKGNATDTGVYYIMYKERNATLKGEGYSTPVSFWMPFNGGQGLHDATWRGSFGGSIYLGGGSHGCVNLPYSAAASIFENVEAGVPVIVY